MFLQYYLNESGDRVYTLKVRLRVRCVFKGAPGVTVLCSSPPQKLCPGGQPTSSAHPARFSPDDKFSRHRVTVKKRFGLLLTQQPKPIL